MEPTLQNLAEAIQVAGIELKAAGERKAKAEQAYLEAQEVEGNAYKALQSAKRNLLSFVEQTA